MILLFNNNSFEEKDRMKKFISNQAGEKYTGSVRFDKQKATISIAGQLQFSGASNAVIIANSDYINKENVQKNKQCKNIINLFQEKKNVKN